jgi:hypothetical protein
VSERGWVYFFRCGEDVKIGWSTNVEERQRAIQTTAPGPLELLGQFRGTRADERALHRRFERYRKHGEWFSGGANLEDAIGFLCSPGLQAEARADAKARLWVRVIEEAGATLRLLAPHHPEDGWDLFLDIHRLVEEALSAAEGAMEQANDRTNQRQELWGRYAMAPIREPQRPSHERVVAEIDRWARHLIDEAAKEETLRRPAYLDLRAIFAGEFEAEQGEVAA